MRNEEGLDNNPTPNSSPKTKAKAKTKRVVVAVVAFLFQVSSVNAKMIR